MDLQEAFDAGFDAVKAYVDRSFAAFEKRIAALEAKEIIHGKDGADGQDGKDADPEIIKALVQCAVDSIPKPKDGDRGEKGEPGESVKPEALLPLIEFAATEAVEAREESVVAKAAERAVSLIPTPENGKDGAPGPMGEKGDRGNCFTSGDGAPENEGMAGDTYLNVLTGDVYSFKS